MQITLPEIDIENFDERALEQLYNKDNGSVCAL